MCEEDKGGEGGGEVTMSMWKKYEFHEYSSKLDIDMRSSSCRKTAPPTQIANINSLNRLQWYVLIQARWSQVSFFFAQAGT